MDEKVTPSAEEKETAEVEGTTAAETTDKNGKKKKKKKTLTGGLLTLWQLLKYSIVSMIGGLTQVILNYVLPLIFVYVTAPIPHWMDFIFNTDSLFDTTTATGLAEYAKYVIDGRLTWGYVLPFFLANIIVNIAIYIENKKHTFKSHAPEWHFVLYFIIMVLTIVFTTWVQGVTFGWLMNFDNGFVRTFSRMIVLIPAGAIQFILFFIVQKLLLPPDDKEAEKAEKAAKKAEKAVAKDEKALSENAKLTDEDRKTIETNLTAKKEKAAELRAEANKQAAAYAEWEKNRKANEAAKKAAKKEAKNAKKAAS